MLSFLAEQARTLGDGFAQKFPGAWLIWEAGNWHPPRAGSETATELELPTGPTHPSTADALCFELEPRDGGAPIRLGRDPSNDVVINDSTVSREHVLLCCNAGAWAVRPVTDRLVKIGGFAISFETPLRSGTNLKLGSVLLTFYDAVGLRGRLGLARPRKAP